MDELNQMFPFMAQKENAMHGGMGRNFDQQEQKEEY